MKRLVYSLSAALCVAVLGSMICGGAAHASAYTPLTLPQLTTDIRTWSGGSNYDGLFSGPGSTTQWTWNGVPFKLAEDSDGNTAYEAPAGGHVSLTIAANVYGATNAYTLINSAWGSYGATIGEVEFFGSAGAYYKVNLVEGTNVRDHYENTFQDVIDNVTAINAFYNGSDRLDEQIYNLPSSFATQTLTSIVFTSYGLGYSTGEPFIAAATVASSPVPLPSAFLLLGPGLAGLIGFRRKFKK